MAARTLVPVAGAEQMLEEAAALARHGDAPEVAAAALARSAARIDLREAEAASREQGRGVLVAARPDGPVLAVRWFAPGEVTTIHGHGTWGVAVVCRGSARHERWTASDGAARLTRLTEVTVGRWTAWDGPPADVHRQAGGPDGALELVLLGAEPTSRELDAATGVLETGAVALASYDVPALARSYRPDVLFDANVPHWRYQLRGPEAVLELVHEELDGLGDLTVTDLRASYAADLATVEVAVRFGSGDHTHRWREVHLLRRDDDTLAEHTVYCTGIWDPATIARQAAEAPMVAP